MKTIGDFQEPDGWDKPPSDDLKWLQEWFDKVCDDEWERAGRVKIESIEGAIWSIDIDLAGTKLKYAESNSEESWNWHGKTQADRIRFKISGGHFRAQCGSQNLKQALEIFRSAVLATE